MNVKIIIVILVFLGSIGVATAHPGHGEPLEVPSEPADPTEGDTGTSTSSDTTTSSSKSSGSTGTSSTPARTDTPSPVENGSEYTGEVDVYTGEDSGSSWIPVLFGVASLLGAVVVYFQGGRLGL